LAVSKVRIGDLRHRITFQTATRTADGIGGFTLAWTDLKTVWAYVKPVSSREALFGGNGKLEDRRTHKVTIRYTTDITNEMRFTYDNRTFEIKGNLRPDERKFFLELDAAEGEAT
jgi:SPP1 family predicted phage head-tail adaptor